VCSDARVILASRILGSAAVGMVLLRPAAGAPDLSTTAERSSFQRTGRYDEVERLCRELESAYPSRARCFTFGQSPEGRPLLALAASDDGVLDPGRARTAARPVVMFVGGIHAGEIDGKDAGFWALRELLATRVRPGALSRVTAVFVPVFNVDGHERFGPHHRPNQRGPEQMGFRTTATNLNLNRDWTKAEAPEMAAMLALLEAWDPTVFVDLHVTDGARFEHDVSVVVTPDGPAPAGLAEAARALRDELMVRLAAAGHLPLPFYPALRTNDDPSSGFAAAPLSPRYSTAYVATRNRLGILVETHSWKTYAQRVRATHDLLGALFELAAARATTWRKVESAADDQGARLGGTEVPLVYDAVAPPRIIEFRGYAYTREPSEISGAPWTRYDEERPQLWRVPLYDRLAPSLVVRAPRAGYLVPPAHAAWLAHKLDLHGLRYQRLTGPARDLTVEAFRAAAVTFASAPFEGRFTARARGQWRPERQTVPAGSLFVPIDQPRARLLLHLLEPTAPDSLVSWGFFHAAFEEKEYMETYVVEEEARKMLARDPRLRAELAQKLAADRSFAASPQQRLRFFSQRHPSHDDRVNLYPIFRADTRP
jgi:Zinc carboxypeptidase